MSLITAFREEPSLRRPAMVLVALVAIVVIGEGLFESSVTGVIQGSASFPVWLPEFGTIGSTVVVYSMLFNFLTFVVIPGILIWLAFQYGRHSAGN